MWELLQNWYEQNQVLFAWGVGISVFTFIGSLIAVPIVVIRMPDDYFLRSAEFNWSLTPLRLLRRLLKNALGAALLLMGIAMLFLPGQGLITILLGLSLIDFPGKRDLQLRLLRIESVRQSVDWMRQKADRPAIRLPD